MFDTFSKNYIYPDQSIKERTLRKLENMNMQDGFRLWYTRWISWPLQKIAFDVTVSTPRKLCCLEDAVLFIYQTIPDNPPDAETIARELDIYEEAFVDEIITEFLMLGALKADSTGRIVITDMGCECCSRGQIPSMSRKQKISLCFDPVAHEFLDSCVFSNGDLNCDENNALHPVDTNFSFADANRIDLDTIRCVAISQKLLSDSDAVIFDAELAETEDDEQSGPDVGYRDVVLLVFLNEQGQINLQVRDLKSKNATKWFQAVLDGRLNKEWISYLLGSLAADGNTATATDTNGRIPLNGDSISLSRIPAHAVQEKIITAVDKAEGDLYIQTICPDDINGHTTALTEAVQNAAKRGVECHLLWADTKINGNVPVHDGIQHRLGSGIGGEFLVANNIILATSVSKVTLPADGSVVHVLTVGKSKSSSACRRLCEKFLAGWKNGKPFEPTKIAVDSEPISQNGKEQITSSCCGKPKLTMSLPAKAGSMA